MSRTRLALLLIIPAAFAPVGRGQDLNVYRGTQVPPQVERIYERGLQFLTAAQNEEGSFPGQYGSEAATPATSGGSSSAPATQSAAAIATVPVSTIR